MREYMNNNKNVNLLKCFLVSLLYLVIWLPYFALFMPPNLNPPPNNDSGSSPQIISHHSGRFPSKSFVTHRQSLARVPIIFERTFQEITKKLPLSLSKWNLSIRSMAASGPNPQGESTCQRKDPLENPCEPVKYGIQI